MRKSLFRLCVLLLIGMAYKPCVAQQTPATKANYPLAARYSPQKLNKLVFSLTVEPHWLKKSDRFWYVYQTSEGKKWYIVDPAKAERKPLFDNASLAAEISKVVGDPFDAQHLGLDSLKFVKDENTIRFEVKSSIDVEVKDTTAKKGAGAPKQKKVFYFEYDLANQTLTELKDYKKAKHKPEWASISPDSSTIVFGKHFNLFWMDRANYAKALKNEDDSTIVEHPLTTDGVEYYSYHGDGISGATGETNVEREKNKDKRKAAAIYWSPDAKHFALERSDERQVNELWVINNLANPRPTLETYKYEMPGDNHIPIDHIMLFDMEAHTHTDLQAGAFKDQTISVWAAPSIASDIDDDYHVTKWLGTKDAFYFSRTSRDLKRVDQCIAYVATGTTRSIIHEELNTYVEVLRPGLVNAGKEMVEWSERDGWAHFYLYDSTGKLERQLTHGPFHCEDILGVDDKKRVLYFTANDRETGEDPYYLHAYRINLDGTGLALLNPGDFDHGIRINDDRLYFVDNFSRVNTVPRSVLYASDGHKIMDLETADLHALLATGYKFPQPFTVKADDGITDLYGVMYKPFDFDSTKKYPLIEYVYPGPQTEAVNKSFSRGMDKTDRMAQLGFIVITVGNRGGHPARSKWYHNFGYGNLRDYGLADKKAVAEQLADKYSFIDIDRVGIHGHSGGGFMSTAAILAYPDFFKVAISSSGNHDNAVYNRWWSEKHNGVKELISEKNDTTFLYTIENNPDLARNLKGHLMLSTGDIDDNVHPANTIRVANALIRANKRFDLVLLPGQRHGYGDMTEYFFWRLADYFSLYLLGDTTSRPVDISEINRDIEQSGARGNSNSNRNSGKPDDEDD